MTFLAADQILAAILFFLYLILTSGYALLFFGKLPARPQVLRVLLVVTLLLHLSYFLFIGISSHSTIFGTPLEMLSGLAFSIALAYFLIEWVTGEKGTGVWILGLSLIFQLISCFRPPAEPSVLLPQSPLVTIHIGLALVGYCAFSISAAFSVMYLVLYHEIKIKHLGLIFTRLPSLEILERMAYRAIHFGLGFLLLSLLIGGHLLHSADVRFAPIDPKILMSALACAYYGAAIIARKPLSIQGKRFAIVSIAGFALILLLLFAGHYFSGFHQFQETGAHQG